jgi:hypothetical protein
MEDARMVKVIVVDVEGEESWIYGRADDLMRTIDWWTNNSQEPCVIRLTGTDENGARMSISIRSEKIKMIQAEDWKS